jgi:hypothetical protein
MGLGHSASRLAVLDYTMVIFIWNCLVAAAAAADCVLARAMAQACKRPT